jgi:hypothetical protein
VNEEGGMDQKRAGQRNRGRRGSQVAQLATKAIACAAVAAITAFTMVTPVASTARQLEPSVVLKPKFTRVAGNVRGLLTSGRYVVVATSVGQSPGPSVVINDQTLSQQQLTAGCDATALGGITLMVECDDQASEGQESQTDLTTGRSSPVTINPALLRGCETPTDPIGCPSVSAIGSDWFTVTGPTGNAHADYFTSYQNRTTGQVVAAPENPKLNIDLNTPSLIGPVCSPLSIPEPDDGTNYPGSLRAVGHGLEIATGDQVYLERCGTHLRIHLYSFSRGYSTPTSGCVTSTYCPPATNAHSIVWEINNPKTGRLQSISGIFVPSLQRFTVKAPKTQPSNSADPLAIAVALTDKHLYLRVGDKLWRAPAPAITRR